jgi:hypothetical protein
LREEHQNYWILKALTVGGMVMTLPMLFEIRMSPQLSALIYGYFPSSFPVEMRDGGYRPVVFMNNGLAAAFFLSTACISAVVLWRLRSKVSVLPSFGIVAYLCSVLVLSKSAGALVYCATIGPLVKWTTPRMQIWTAVLIAIIALTYPALRLSFLFPTEQIVEAASSLSKQRSESLQFRFNQEDALLAHASERLVFGWGRYGRNRVYWESGDDASVTDGLWIITLGQFGLIGFIGQFGLLTLPVFRSIGALRNLSNSRDKLLLSTLSLLVAVTVIEQLPNESITPWSWLLSGALLGRTEAIRQFASKRAKREKMPLSPNNGTIRLVS